MFDEKTDWFCSGCGKKIREIAVDDNKTQYTLYYGRGSSPLKISIENIGEFPVQITKWQLVNLKALKCLCDGRKHAPVALLSNDTKVIEINFDDSGLPFTQAGILKIYAGIIPPIQVVIICTPVPGFIFHIGNELVRNSKVCCLGDLSKEIELPLKIEVRHAHRVKWTKFRMYPKNHPERSFPLPSGLEFPVDLFEGIPSEICCPLGRITGAEVICAEFLFENCQPETFTIDIIPKAKIKHEQDFNPINENAFIKGKSGPRNIEISLVNDGGVGADIVDIKIDNLSKSWMNLVLAIDNPKLMPYGDSKSRFVIKIDPAMIKNTLEEGRIQIVYREDDISKIQTQEIFIPVEVKYSETLPFPIGIDFGNTSTCVSYFNPKINEFELVALDEFNGEKKYEFPTIIEFNRFCAPGEHESGTGFGYGYLLGETRYAVEERGDNLLNRAWHFKQGLGQNKPISKLDRTHGRLRQFTAEVLTKYFIKEVIQRFEENTGYDVKSIILTYPAGFMDDQIKSLKNVVEQIKPDLEIITEISEPEALALHYLNKKEIIKDKEIFAVFDYGGSSTDITIGQISCEDGEKEIEVLVSMGSNQLGGDLLTFEIAKSIYNKIQDEFKRTKKEIDMLFPMKLDDIFLISHSEKETRFNFMNLMNKAEMIKTNREGLYWKLCDHQEIPVEIHSFHRVRGQFEPIRVNYNIEDFKNVAERYIQQGLNHLNGMLQHLKEHEIIEKNCFLDFVVLGGNSSRLELVKKLARDILGLDENNIFFESEITKTGVASGAALYGMKMQDPDSDIVFINNRRVRYPIGIYKPNSFDVIFPAGAQIGATIKRQWKPVKLFLYRNLDPSNLTHSSLEPVTDVGYDLSRYKSDSSKKITFYLTLSENGVKIQPENNAESSNNDSDLIEFKWY